MQWLEGELEEQRISMMYVNILKRRLLGAWDGLFPRGLRRSAALPWLVILLVLVVPAVGWYLHIRGQFATMKREIRGEQQGPPVNVARPGGAEVVVLKRTASSGSDMPELVSATLLPGLGMSVLQVTAQIPGRGELPLLVAPSVDAMADGSAGPRAGRNDDRGALEVPWAEGIEGVLSPIGTSITTSWRGHQLDLPTGTQGREVSEGGLLATMPADSMTTLGTGDATGSTETSRTTATGTFHAGDFGGKWPGKTEVTVTASLEAQRLDLTVRAKNVGDQAEPMGVGWNPRFAVVGGDRGRVELRLPMGDRLEIADRAKGTPSGKTTSGGAADAYVGHAAALKDAGLDETLIHLRPAMMDSGVSAEMRDPAAKVGLRLTAVSANVRALQVSAPANGEYVSLGMSTNYDDPLGREWTAENGPGIAVLQPGETMEWKVRLEIFPVTER